MLVVKSIFYLIIFFIHVRVCFFFLLHACLYNAIVTDHHTNRCVYACLWLYGYKNDYYVTKALTNTF